MNIGIVTTWFERGAAYVSKQFENVLSQEYDVFIYARGGEKYAKGDNNWDKANVTWASKRNAPFSGTLIDKKDFVKWVKKNKIEKILFNEQEWWYPILWCDELKIPSISYVDYYKKDTISLFSSYTALICNTLRHYSAFNWHPNSFFVPWGTDCSVFKPIAENFKLVNDNFVTFFHSCGMDPYRKGTDILLRASENISENFELIIHTQIDLKSYFNEDINNIIDKLERNGKLKIINKTVSAPGLYHLGDVYVYPSRLEGVGLTIAEAVACGLVPLVTNNAPMNEFTNNKIGFLIDVSNYFGRSDGYYWPECTPDVIGLKNNMIEICNNKQKIVKLKEANFNFAINNLNWEKNSKEILNIFNKVKYLPLNENIKIEVERYEENGFRRINKIYLKHYWLMSFVMKAIKKYFK